MATSTIKYTRMDLTAVYGGVAVKCWSGHWQEGAAPEFETFREGVSIDQACMVLEDAGWSVLIYHPRNGNQIAKALRGEDTRIDYFALATGLVVKHYPYGWKAGTRPTKIEHLPINELESLLEDRRLHGWTVRTWKNGARAWKGEPLPVRNANEIMVLRHRVEKDFVTQGGAFENARGFNLAFDF